VVGWVKGGAVTCDKLPVYPWYGYGFCAGIEMSHRTCDRKHTVLPVPLSYLIPGPNPPRVMDSFLYRSLQHLAALQKDSLVIWDGSKDANVSSNPFFALATADGPGLTHLNGLVGHMGKNGCRMYCSVRGR
jgi:hypothetical protein